LRDEISIFFSNPATDPLGYDCVEGKLLCDHQGVTLRFKQKDRAFKKNDPVVLSFSYAEVEKLTWNSRLLGAKTLTLRTRGTDKLKVFPGGEVEQVVLFVEKNSRDDAARVPEFVEYFQSEAYLHEQEARMKEARGDQL
jgi:hypothetical protein